MNHNYNPNELYEFYNIMQYFGLTPEYHYYKLHCALNKTISKTKTHILLHEGIERAIYACPKNVPYYSLLITLDYSTGNLYDKNLNLVETFNKLVNKNGEFTAKVNKKIGSNNCNIVYGKTLNDLKLNIGIQQFILKNANWIISTTNNGR